VTAASYLVLVTGHAAAGKTTLAMFDLVEVAAAVRTLLDEEALPSGQIA
jgi:hypothetical protein